MLSLQQITCTVAYSMQERYNFFFTKSYSVLIITVPPRVIFFMNCGRKEFQLLEVCFRVRYNSKVEAVYGSHFMVLSLLQSCSPAKFKYRVHPLRPQGSESANASISRDITCRRPQGNSTSPQDRWVRLAARSSVSRRFESALTAASQSPSSDVGYGSYSQSFWVV